MLYIKWGRGLYFYKNLSSDDSLHKSVPSLLPSLLFILLTSQKYISRQEIALLDPPSLGLKPQIWPTALHNELQPETESRDLIPGRTYATCTIWVTKQQTSPLEMEYKQKKQRLEQKESVLVTRDMLKLRSIESHMCLVSIMALLITKSVLAHSQRCALNVRPKTRVWSILSNVERR